MLCSMFIQTLILSMYYSCNWLKKFISFIASTCCHSLIAFLYKLCHSTPQQLTITYIITGIITNIITNVIAYIQCAQSRYDHHRFHGTKYKPHLGMVVVGHAHSGTSTLTGRLLFELGCFTENELAKLKKEAQELGRESFLFALYLDKLKEERWNGFTFRCSRHNFFTQSYHYTIIDAPGRRRFLKNSMIGISEADVALLMVPANRGEIIGGALHNARLCHVMGIEQIIVGINKMDDESVNYSQDRYEEIKEEVSRMLTKIGYKTKRIPFIPMSALNGDNLTENSSNMPWYNGFEVKIKNERIKGVTLMDALEKMIKPTSNRQRFNVSYSKLNILLYGYIASEIDISSDRSFANTVPLDIIQFIGSMLGIEPFRMPISEIYKVRNVGDVIAGKVEQGALSQGANVRFHPSGCFGTVSSIQIPHKNVSQIECGDYAGLNIIGLSRHNMPRRGDVMVIYDKYIDPNPPKSVKSFTALVWLYCHPGKLQPGKPPRNYGTGYEPTVYVRTARVTCLMIEIQWKKGKRTMYAKVEHPSYIEQGDQAQVVFQPKKPLVVTPYDECKPFGRVAIVDSNQLVMIGKVISVEHK